MTDVIDRGAGADVAVVDLSEGVTRVYGLEIQYRMN
jgi:hypothetical protein